MARTPAQRMAAYRTKQRAAGLATVSLLVPREDVAGFQRLATLRRRNRQSVGKAKPRRTRWFATDSEDASEDTGSNRVKVRLSSGRSRTAEAVAERLWKIIIARGWVVGDSLATEGELMETLSVSRTMLRCAMRILESYSVVTHRRGTSGGFMVCAPSVKRTNRAVSIYLEYERITPENIIDARKMLEQTMVALAVKRLTAGGRKRINAQLQAESHLDGTASSASLQRFHLTIGELSGNPALRLFGGIILRLSDAHSTFARRSRVERDRIVSRIKALHRRIGEAMVAGSAQAAHDLVDRYLSGYRNWME